MADCLAIRCGIQGSIQDQYACAQSGDVGALSPLDSRCASYYPPVPSVPIVNTQSPTQPLTIFSLTAPGPDIVAAAQGPQIVEVPSFFCEMSQAVSDHPVEAAVILGVIFFFGTGLHKGGR